MLNTFGIISIYTDEDLYPHNHRRWLYVLIHLSVVQLC